MDGGRKTLDERGNRNPPDEYEKEMAEVYKRAREKEERQRELHWDEVYANFQKAVAMLSRQTGVHGDILHTKLCEAMGITGFPEVLGSTNEKFEQATALIHGYHPVVRLLGQLRNANKITDSMET